MRDTGGAEPNQTFLLDSVTRAECRQGEDWSLLSGTFEIPAGYDEVRFSLQGFPRAVLEGSHLVNEFTPPGDPVENDPDCVPAGTGGDSPHFAPSDDPRFDNDDQHLTSRVSERVINNSGGDLEAGDLVVPDITFDGNGVTTTTTAASTASPVGVVLDGGADGDQIVVVWSGVLGFVNDGAETSADGDYLFTSTTAGAAATDATRATGAVGRVVRDASGDPQYVLWWGVPDLGAGTHATSHEDGGSDELEVTDLATSETDTDLVLHPDGSGGVVWDTDATGGGGGGSGNVIAEPTGSDVVISGLALGDRLPGTPGTYDEEFDGTADTLPTDWAWTSAPSGSDLWSLNSRWPSMLTVEGTGDTVYVLTRTSFSPSSAFGLWVKFHEGQNKSGDEAGMRIYVSNAGSTEKRGLNYRSTGTRASGIRGLRIISSVESVWGNEMAIQPHTYMYLGMTRDSSNNWFGWYSHDGIAWDVLSTTQSHSFTIDRIQLNFQTTDAPSFLGVDWIRYRADDAFPRP
jgi:hypothetical protein